MVGGKTPSRAFNTMVTTVLDRAPEEVFVCFVIKHLADVIAIVLECNLNKSHFCRFPSSNKSISDKVEMGICLDYILRHATRYGSDQKRRHLVMKSGPG